MSEWNGEGLPPIGVECEYLYDAGGEWRVGKCVAHYREMAVIVDPEDCGAECCIEQRVRPIRSERDEFITWATKTIGLVHDEPRLGRLYDAGFRKQ